MKHTQRICFSNR